jgi:phage-related baseplate assembly protein
VPRFESLLNRSRIGRDARGLAMPLDVGGERQCGSYCVSVHRLTLAARQWAAKSPVTAEMTNKIIRDREKIQVAFDQLVERLKTYEEVTCLY